MRNKGNKKVRRKEDRRKDKTGKKVELKREKWQKQANSSSEERLEKGISNKIGLAIQRMLQENLVK